MILDLHQLNVFIWKLKFSMVTLASIISSQEDGDMVHRSWHGRCLLSLKHSPIPHNVSQVLPWARSLSLQSPPVHTRYRVMVAQMRRNGFTVFPCLENWLLMGRSGREVQSATLFVLHLFSYLAVCINKQKSTLIPTRTINFITATLDSARTYLLMERFYTMSNLIKQVTLRLQTGSAFPI